MFENKMPQHEPLDDALRTLKQDIHPDAELKSAAVELSQDAIISPRVHVKQVTKATLLYATCVALLLGALLFLPRLFNSQSPVGNQSSVGTQTSAPTDTMPWDDPSLSETDRKIRKAADPLVMELYDIDDLSDFNIIITDYTELFKNYKGPRYEICYRLTIGDIVTDEYTSVKVNSDFTTESMMAFKHTLYYCYLPNATEEAIQSAKDKITEKAVAYEESSQFYLEIDNEGYLCLKTEIISHVAQSDSEDHRHIFFSERICAPAIIYEWDTLKNPQQFTEDEIEIIRSLWIRHKADALQIIPGTAIATALQFSPDTTINTIASNFKTKFFMPCGDGYVLFDYDVIPNSGSRPYQVTVGEYEFRYTSGNTLMYYQDGQFYYLDAAYGEYYNLITDKQLQAIWEAYKAKFPSLYESDQLTNPEQYTELEMKAIQAVWDAYKDRFPSEYTMNDILQNGLLSDISQYDEAIVIGIGIGDEVVTEDVVLDYRFIYPSTGQKRVFANGKVYTLQSAFDAGVLTEEEIRMIWENHKAQFPVFYQSDE